jgi:integrase
MAFNRTGVVTISSTDGSFIGNPFAEDERIFATRLLPAFGPDTPVRQISEAAIAQYERQRLADVSGATIKLQLSILRHALRLARKWGYLDQDPEIEMPKKSDGQPRYLDEAEIVRLLAACRASRNPNLVAIVTVAINTGMRKAEILGLTWEHVDLASARITLYDTKNGRPRGVPINRAVYDALIRITPTDCKFRGDRLDVLDHMICCQEKVAPERERCTV